MNMKRSIIQTVSLPSAPFGYDESMGSAGRRHGAADHRKSHSAQPHDAAVLMCRPVVYYNVGGRKLEVGGAEGYTVSLRHPCVPVSGLISRCPPRQESARSAQTQCNRLMRGVLACFSFVPLSRSLRLRPSRCEEFSVITTVAPILVLLCLLFIPLRGTAASNCRHTYTLSLLSTAVGVSTSLPRTPQHPPRSSARFTQGICS